MAFIQLAKINQCIQEYKKLRYDGVLSISEFDQEMKNFLSKYDILNQEEKAEFLDYLVRT